MRARLRVDLVLDDLHEILGLANTEIRFGGWCFTSAMRTCVLTDANAIYVSDSLTQMSFA